MRGWAFNAQGAVVARPQTTSMDELLMMAYRWNEDEEREHMTVARVEFAGLVSPVAVQGVLSL